MGSNGSASRRGCCKRARRSPFLALGAGLFALSAWIALPVICAHAGAGDDPGGALPFQTMSASAGKLMQQGNLAEAETVLHGLVDAERAHPEGPGALVGAMVELGLAQTLASELPEAEATYRAALQEADTPPVMTGSVRALLVALLVNERRPEEARRIIEPVLDPDRRTAAGGDHFAVVTVLNDDTALAAVDTATGNFAEAADRLQADLNHLDPSVPPPENLESARFSLASLLQHEGKVAEAEGVLTSLLSHPDSSSPVAQTSQLLEVYGVAVALEREGKLRDAERMARESLALSYRLPMYPKSDSGPLQVMRAVAGPNLQELARVLRLESDNGEAVAVDRMVCQIYQETNTSFEKGASLWARSAAPVSADCELEAALSLRALAEGGLADTSSIAGGADPRYASTLTASDLSDQGLRLDPPATSADPGALLAEAFERGQGAQQSAAGQALSQAAAQAAAQAAGAGAVALAYEQALAHRGSLEQKLAAVSDDSPAAASERQEASDQISRVDQQIAGLARELKARWAPYWDYRSPAPIALAALQSAAGDDAKLLRSNEAVVLWIYAPGTDKGLVFAVSKRKAAWAEMSLTGDELTAKVGCLRAGLDPTSYGADAPLPAGCSTKSGFDPAVAHEIYQALLGDPRVADVLSDVDTLLIVPSGPLTSLPPGLLVDEPPTGVRPHWLVEDKAIAILPSVGSLRSLRLQPRGGQPAAAPMLGFVDPDFGGDGATPGLNANADPFDPKSLSLTAPAAALARPVEHPQQGGPPAEWVAAPALPGTLAEGVDLAVDLHAPHDSLVYGPNATRAAVFAHNQDGSLERARVVVFATHGLFAGQFQGVDEPGLLMARPPAPADGLRDNWLLSATDVTSLKLGADWVLLSACDTAAPGSVGAEGLSGLARAFFYAGARSLLVSHWLIYPQQAGETVDETFRLLADPGQRLSKAQALRQAQLKLMSEHPDPREWAPFVLVGDPD
jgi:CHAT domain-containing protein/tetratricopeptide (TPR) repeat protein